MADTTHDAVQRLASFEVDGITYTPPRRPYAVHVRPMIELLPDHHQCSCQHPGTTHRQFWFGSTAYAEETR